MTSVQLLPLLHQCFAAPTTITVAATLPYTHRQEVIKVVNLQKQMQEQMQ